jgi:hypothetical protein
MSLPCRASRPWTQFSSPEASISPSWFQGYTAIASDAVKLFNGDLLLTTYQGYPSYRSAFQGSPIRFLHSAGMAGKMPRLSS